jgi:hypothetical protein
VHLQWREVMRPVPRAGKGVCILDGPSFCA